MKILIKLLDNVSAVTILSIGGIFAPVILQVFCRFVLKTPLPWPVEISKILFGYLVFIGCAEASRQRTYTSIDPQEVFGIPDHVNVKLDIFRNIAVLAVLAP